MKKFFLSVAVLFFSFSANCQNPLLLKDVFPGNNTGTISQIVKTSNYTFFNEDDDDADTNKSLFRTDGTPAGTIKLNLTSAGFLGTKVDKLTAFGDKIVFSGDNSATYGEIWVSDGTQSGTIALDKTAPSVGSSAIYDITTLGSSVLYGLTDNSNHTQLKKTDGTIAGTSVIYDFSSFIAPQIALSKVINNILYFNIYDSNGSGVDQLWRSDGTTAGTYMLKDFGLDQYVASWYMPANSGLFYWMIVKPGTGNVLWKSDGTVAGTESVKTIGTTGNNNYPQFAATIGNNIAFAGLDGNGKELWITDGTAAGTNMVADINPGTASSNPSGLIFMNNHIYFSATTATSGNELWESDGNASGTVLVKDINPGSASSSPSSFVISNNTIIFRATTATNGTELWITDGTASNTLIAADINPGINSSSPNGFTTGNPVYFAANNGVNGFEVFKYDNSNGFVGLHKFYVNDNSTSNDAFTTSIGNDTNLGTAAAPFATIQHAADVAPEGSIIYVDAGVYFEQVTLNKGLSLIGVNSGLTIVWKPAVINPPPGTFTEPGTIQSAQNIGDVHIRDMSITGDDNGVTPIVLQTGGSVKYCRLIGGNQGIFFRVDPAIKTAVIENNYISVQYIGINCQGSGLTATLTNNTIDLNNSGFAAGVFAGLDFGPLVQFTATGNSINRYNYVGFLANSYNTNITQNSILGTGGYALQQYNFIPAVATCNWYGTTNAGTIASKVSGLFSYTPYLTNGTNSIVNNGSGGFVPVAGSCNEGINNFYVNDNSRTNDVFTTAVGSNANSGTSTAPFATLSYAVSVAPANSVIHVDAGTYAEQVIIDKGILINGAGRELTNFVKPASALIPAPGPFTEIGLIETTQGIGDVHIRNISVNSVDGSSQNIIIQSGGSVKNCKLLNGGQGVFFRIASGSRYAAVEFNIIQPIGIGVNCQGAGLTANIVNNTISKAGGYYAGVFAGLDFGFLPQITITNNTISDYFGIGILARANISNVTNNSIVGTPQSIAIQGNTLNATCNWYGSNTPAISGPVVYSPFLTNGTDNDINNQGFQPVPDSCNGVQHQFYVNDNSNTGNVFTTAIGDNNNSGAPSAPLATITAAIGKAQNGDIIFVDAGTYAERIFVNKSLSFKGANTANDPGTSLNRGLSESILVPSTENNLAEIITVQATDVSIDGFLFDGDNPALTGSINLNGIDINAGMGISNGNLATNNLIVQNNIFKNFFRYGIFLQRTGAALTGINISHNHIDNISSKTPRDGRGVGLFSNAYATVTNNYLTRVNTGVIMANFNNPSADSVLIEANTIEAYSYGINLNGNSNITSSVIINNNQFTVADLTSWSAPGSSTVNSCTGIGIFNLTSNKNVSINNNVVTGTQTGIYLFSIVTPQGIQVNGGSVSNSSQIGLFYNNRGIGAAKLSLNNVSLINNVVGMDASAADTNNMQLEFSGVTIDGGTTGIRFYGQPISLPANTLSGVSFSNQTKEYILQTVNAFQGQTIDASTVSFDGVTPINMTLAQLFATEDKLTHKIDIDNVGYFKLKPTEVFVTPNSFAADLPPSFGIPTTNTEINRAVGAASIGDVIHIKAGTYINQINIDKALTIIGEGKDLTSILKPAVTVAPPGNFLEQGVIQTAQGIVGDVHISDLSVTGDFNVNVTPIIIQCGGSVKNCKLQNGNQGIFVRVDPAINPTGKTFVVDGNIINAEYIAVNFGGGTSLIATLTNNTLATFNPGFSTCVFAGTDFGTLGGLTVTGNSFSTFVTDGLYVNTNNGTISQNSFTGTGQKAINKFGGSTINATCNWYGSGNAATVSLKINGSVNYTPWLTNGTDSDLVSNGFQPLPNICNGTPVAVFLDNSNNLTCNSANNGTINITVSNGLAPYSFLWTNSDDQGFSSSNEDLTNLASGTYQLLLTDTNGSTASLSNIVISEPQLLTATADGTNNLCFGQSNATAFVVADGGTTPYTYLWNNGATTDEISNLAAGTYSVTVTDANGCTKIASYEVTQPSLLTASIANNSTACSNNATVTALAGTPGYTYIWSNGATTASINNVPVGTYNVTVTDANQCSTTASISLTVVEAFNPSASVTNVSCFGGSNGAISVTNANGTAPFTFSIDGLTFLSGTFPYSFNSLSAGTYNIAVKDANGCTGFVTKTITEPPLLSATIITVQSTCSGQSTGAISAATAGGSGALSYSWTGTGSYTSNQKNISGLATGNYSLTVTDKNGCTTSLNVYVPTYNAIVVSAAVTNILCKGSLTGAINLTVTGGSGSGFAYSWTGNTISTSEDISNLGASTNYNVTITDIGSGCLVTKSYAVTQPASSVSLAANKTNAAGCGGSLGTITATGSGGTSPYEYKLDNGTYQSSGVFTSLYSGNYTVWVKDANGCNTTKVVAITDSGSDQYESNNSKNQAKLISVGTTINARIALATDTADWFKFITPAGNGNYKLNITHPTVNYTFNMYPSANNAAALVPTSSTSTSKIYALTGGTTYYVQITGALSYTCYDLSVIPVAGFAKSSPDNAKVIAINELIIKAYPNPHHGSFNLSIKSLENGTARIELFTILGQLLATRDVSIEKDQNTIVEFNDVGRGIILYHVTIGNKIINGKVYGND